MRVAIDDQIFTTQVYGGISRYFVELMHAYHSDDALGVVLTTSRIWTKNRLLIEHGFGQRLPSSLGHKGKVIRLANRLRSVTERPEIVHHTYYDRRYLKRYGRSTVRVITVYDMIPERFPELFPHGNPHRDKREFVAAADLILCISHATRQNLIDVYGDLKAPVVVTPLGVDASFQPGLPRPLSFPEQYVLFVGSRGGYKDFNTLVEAFARLPADRDLQLVAVGGGPLRAHERSKLDQLGICQRVIQTDVADTELAGAYSNAQCFVFPSHHEGFGLPTLEALASGCLTILASSPAHHEVGGDAALYYPPGDAAELARLMNEVVSSDERHASQRVKGVAHAARFTWRETARLTVAAYREHGGER